MDFSYEGKLPGKKQRRALAADALRKALSAVERGEEVDVGFAEDSKRRLRRDVYQVEKIRDQQEVFRLARDFDMFNEEE